MDLSYDTIMIENFIQTLYLPYTASMIGSSAKKHEHLQKSDSMTLRIYG